MDIERVRYSLARYLRIRLLKIQKNLECILSDINLLDRLSDSEKSFISKLNTINNNYYEDNVSARLNDEAKGYYEGNQDRLSHSTPNLQVKISPICIADSFL